MRLRRKYRSNILQEFQKEKTEKKKITKEIIPENLLEQKNQPSIGQVPRTTHDIHSAISGL